MTNAIAADLFCDVPAESRAEVKHLFPGLMLATACTLAAGFISDHYGAPLTLMALLLGLALNFLSSDVRVQPGLRFASHTLLRLGIVLVGCCVTANQMVDLGPIALVCVACIVALTIGVGVITARWIGIGTAFGILAGGSVAICGASAAMALATTLGPRRTGEAQLTLVLVGISAMSAAAMALYPIVAHMLGLSDLRAGFLLGASIHDVAQALGAGYAYSDGAGQIAAIVKLTRVALLAPVLAIVALFLPRTKGDSIKGAGIPWFVVGFFLLAGLNSLGWIPATTSAWSAKGAAAMLAAAVAATAIRSPLPRLLEAGIKPLLVIFAATLTAFGLALLSALFAVG